MQSDEGSEAFEVGVQMDVEIAVDDLEVFESVQGYKSWAAEDIDGAFDGMDVLQSGQVLELAN